MQTLLLTDHATAHDEHSLLSRLAVALSDASVGVVQAMPGELPAAPAGVLCSPVVAYRSAGLSFSLSRRVRDFVGRLPEHLSLSPGDQEDATVVHVFGRGAWEFALRLREQTGAAMVFELASIADVEPLADVLERAARLADPATVGVVSPSERFLEALRRIAPAAPGTLARWGVHARPDLPPAGPGTGVVSLGVLAPRGGGQEACVRSVIEAVAILAGSRPDLLVFLDSRAGERRAVWRAARRCGVLDRLTLVTDVERRPEQFLQTSLLIVPERMGACRSILLSAMAIGLPIVARRDPESEWFVDDQTAVLTDARGHARSSGALSAHVWVDAIKELLHDSARLARLRASAHAFVRERHAVPVYVRSLLAAYERCVQPAPAGASVGG